MGEHSENKSEKAVNTITPDLIRLYADSDALTLAETVKSGDVTASELVETAITVIEALDDTLNAVVIRTFEEARATAQKPATGPFAGVPFLMKNIASMWKGTSLTSGMRYLKDFVCAADSEMVQRIKASGLIMLGRSNVPENGWSIGTETSLHGATSNPWNTDYTPGGSSGGAAAALAARMVPIAEGADGGGSIRAPASCCGLIGLKPSRGRITYGPDEVDPWFGSIVTLCLSRTVRDTAAYLDAVAGSAVGDPYILPLPDISFLANLENAPRRLKIGFTKAPPWGAPCAPEVIEAVDRMASLCEAMGHDVEERALGLPLEEYWVYYNDINAVENAALYERLAPIVGRPVSYDDLAPFNAALLEYGRSLDAVTYAQSIGAVRKASQQIARRIDSFDVYMTPTLTQPPRPVGYWSLDEGDREAYLRRWADAGYLFPFNLSGLPAISVPAGRSALDLPIGVQFVSGIGQEGLLLRLARQIEIAAPWNDRVPPISALSLVS